MSWSDLGLVGLSNKGEWNDTFTYNRGNFVLHDGSTYVALVQHSGVEPGTDRNTWQILAQGSGSTFFIGTTAEWNALPTDKKAECRMVVITDD